MSGRHRLERRRAKELSTREAIDERVRFSLSGYRGGTARSHGHTGARTAELASVAGVDTRSRGQRTPEEPGPAARALRQGGPRQEAGRHGRTVRRGEGPCA